MVDTVFLQIGVKCPLWKNAHVSVTGTMERWLYEQATHQISLRYFLCFLIFSLGYRLCVHSTTCVLQGMTIFSQNRKQIFLAVILIFLVSIKLNFVTEDVTGLFH